MVFLMNKWIILARLSYLYRAVSIERGSRGSWRWWWPLLQVHANGKVVSSAEVPDIAVLLPYVQCTLANCYRMRSIGLEIGTVGEAYASNLLP